jgi:4-carboxymuconolactone decarboxylase
LSKRPAAPRIPLVERKDYSADQATLAGGRDQYNLTRMLVQHPDFYRAFVPFLTKMMSGSVLVPRDREILILRTLGLCDESYEEHHHMSIGQAVGMSAEEATAARDGRTAQFAACDRYLIKAAEELVNDRCLSDSTWNALAQAFTVNQMIEVVFLVGSFTMLSMATNSFGMPVGSNP